MKKLLAVFLGSALLVCLSSCATLDKISKALTVDERVIYEKPYEEVKAMADRCLANETYLRKFTAQDREKQKCTVIIFDSQYMMIDSVIYAYRVNGGVFKKLALGFGGKHNTHEVDGTERLVGLSLYATPVLNQELTISCTFVRESEMWGVKKFKNKTELYDCPGFYITGISGTKYIDDFGHLRKKTAQDRFDEIFGSASRDVREKMYAAIQYDYIHL